MRLRNHHGFTIVELLMYMVLALIVVGAAYTVLVAQSRHSQEQMKTMDVRQTLRGAASLLASNLRHASSSRGDLLVILPQSMTLRAVYGGGTVCNVLSKFPRFALWQVAGAPAQDDSVHIYDPVAGIWDLARIKKVWDPGGAGASRCAWGTSYRPEMVLELIGVPDDTAFVGGVVQAFQVTEYAMTLADGRWWLGRRVGAAKSYEVMTGPLLPPSQGGLAFRYFDAGSAETTDPAQVERVEITLRGESHAGVSPRRDSVTTTIFLRN